MSVCNGGFMILEGSKFSISFLKDNFSKLLLIVSLPFILELIITSISVNYMTDESSAEFVSFSLILLIQTWAQCTIIFYIHNQIFWLAGLTLASGSVVGSWLSARLSISKGEQTVRTLFRIFIVALIVKLFFF